MSKTVCPECGHAAPADEFFGEQNDPAGLICECRECGFWDLVQEFTKEGGD